MNILVTGANGFIGKALTKRLLSLGYNVFAIVTSKDDMNDIVCDNLHIFEIFFENYNKISRLIKAPIDIAYHFAWWGLSGKEAKDVDIQLSNVKAVAELLNQLKIIGTKKMVFASTMNILEVRSALVNPLVYSPRGVYVHVAAKINAEIIARTFCYENNIEYNEGVVAMAYGEGNKSKMIPNVFIYSLLNGVTPKLVTGNNPYDIIYIQDIVEAFICIGQKGKNKKSYYVGHNWNKTFKDIFNEIKDIINADSTIIYGAYPEDNAIDYSTINRDELFNDTGWKPSYDFKQSIINTANWIKSGGFKVDG